MSDFPRREFLKTGAALAAATALSPNWPSARPFHLPVGIQLYTVKEELAKDFDGTLKKVAAIGYKEVEAAGFYGKSASEFRKSIEAAGLTIPSAHYSLQDLLDGFDAKLAFAHQLGLKYIICSFPFVAKPGRFHAEKFYEEFSRGITLDDWKWNFDQFNRLGEETNKAAIKFGYHNHNIEFRTLNGVLVYDELLRLTDPARVTMEMDIGWVAATGHDPVAYLEKFPQRYELLHVKDIKPGPPTTEGEGTGSTELGHGTVDWKNVLAAAKKASVKHYFVEQEDPFKDHPVMDAIKIDYEFLSKF
jgi:sugar phosphate isomerase/epimerase